jgi:hypothetical protein
VGSRNIAFPGAFHSSVSPHSPSQKYHNAIILFSAFAQFNQKPMSLIKDYPAQFGVWSVLLFSFPSPSLFFPFFFLQKSVELSDPEFEFALEYCQSQNHYYVEDHEMINWRKMDTMTRQIGYYHVSHS